MLVITRKIGESLVIGGDITVTVVKVAGGGVRLGIQAPADYVVVRNELQDSVDHEAETSQAEIPQAETPPARSENS